MSICRLSRTAHTGGTLQTIAACYNDKKYSGFKHDLSAARPVSDITCSFSKFKFISNCLRQRESQFLREIIALAQTDGVASATG